MVSSVTNTKQCSDAIQLVTVGGYMPSVSIVSHACKDGGNCLICLM